MCISFTEICDLTSVHQNVDCGCLKPLFYKLLNKIIISASGLACYSFKYNDNNVYKEL